MKRYENGKQVSYDRHWNLSPQLYYAELNKAEPQQREECEVYVVDDSRKKSWTPRVGNKKRATKQFIKRPSLDWMNAESDAL